MAERVHIVNGDSTAHILKESKLSGDIVVWREMLCDGPLSKNIGSDEFWSLRYSFFENELQVERLEYYDKTIKELVKIENLSKYDEVVLWFEYDLFCQVNLMGLCTYLLDYYRKDISYYLVCTGYEKNKESLQTLYDYAPTKYHDLYEGRLKLTRHDFLFAAECWKTYVDGSYEQIKSFNFKKNRKFNYFQLAMNQHLKRFTETAEISQIDRKILETIQDNNYTEREIIKEMLLWQKNETVYGFGDRQYSKYLENLSPFYAIKDGHYYLNTKGTTSLKK